MSTQGFEVNPAVNGVDAYQKQQAEAVNAAQDLATEAAIEEGINAAVKQFAMPPLGGLLQWLTDGTGFDNSGNGNTATYTGGRSLYFDGATTILETGLVFDESTNDVDITMTIVPKNFTAASVIITDRGGTYMTFQVLLLTTGKLKVQVITNDGGASAQETTANTALTVGVENTFRLTINMTTGVMNLYLNGSAVADVTDTYTGTFEANGGTVNIGAGSGLFFDGHITYAKLDGYFEYVLEEGLGDVIHDIGKHSSTNTLTVPQRLDVPSYVGDEQNEIVHPDIVVFDEPWNGYKYWMSYMPYAGSDAKLENASIAVSNDKKTWIVPPGLSNPVGIVPPPLPDDSNSSDSELVYDEANDSLHIFYVTQGGELGFYSTIVHMSSTDGITWVYEGYAFDKVYMGTERFSSPTIVWTGTQWFMLTMDLITRAVDARDCWRYRTASSLDGPWSSSAAVTAVNVPADMWHQKLRKVGSNYVMLANLGSGSGGVNYFVESSDPTSWDLASADLVVSTIGGKPTYRSTFWPRTNGSVIDYEMFINSLDPWGVNYATYEAEGNDGAVTGGTWEDLAVRSSTNIVDGFTPTLLSDGQVFNIGAASKFDVDTTGKLEVEFKIEPTTTNTQVICGPDYRDSFMCRVEGGNATFWVQTEYISTPITLNEEQIVKFIYDNGDMSGYVNGIVDETAVDTSAMSANTLPLRILGSPVTGQVATETHFHWLKISIDDVLISEFRPYEGGRVIDIVDGTIYSPSGVGSILTKQFPAKADGLGSVNYAEISNPSNMVHNGAEDVSVTLEDTSVNTLDQMAAYTSDTGLVRSAVTEDKKLVPVNVSYSAAPVGSALTRLNEYLELWE